MDKRFKGYLEHLEAGGHPESILPVGAKPVDKRFRRYVEHVQSSGEPQEANPVAAERQELAAYAEELDTYLSLAEAGVDKDSITRAAHLGVVMARHAQKRAGAQSTMPRDKFVEVGVKTGLHQISGTIEPQTYQIYEQEIAGVLHSIIDENLDTFRQ